MQSSAWQIYIAKDKKSTEEKREEKEAGRG
jgi:hypothetical protein